MLHHTLASQPKFQAGRLASCFDKWSTLTSDRTILQTIQGFTLEFSDRPSQQKIPGQILRGHSDIAIAQDLLTRLLTKGVIEETKLDKSGYISNIFLRPKRSGDHRLILNLKGLNDHVQYHHFKMDHLSSALGLVTPNCFFASLDLADAYYSVKVDPQHRKYLQFSFQGKHYRFTCLANGISSAPRTFTKLMKVPLSKLRAQFGHLITAYLDDLLLVAQTPDELIQATQHTLSLLQSLGFHISQEKSSLVPSHITTFLGFTLDSTTMTVSLPVDKVSSIKASLTDIRRLTQVPIRHFAALLGRLTATLPANRYGRVFLKHLEMAKTKALHQNKYNYDAFLQLNSKVLGEFQWWLDNLDHGYRPILLSNPDLVVYTDASFQGWGCYVPKYNVKTGGRWTVEEGLKDINYLELKAVLLTLRSCCDREQHNHILVKSDNTTTVVSINKQGSTHSANCNTVARDIWFWAIERNVWLSATHCPGVLNTEADAASRVFNDALEWKLNPITFHSLCLKGGKPTIDLFASRLNYQVDTYCAFQPDPGAVAIDAFTLDWSQFDLCYAFPPFSVIPRVLQKIQRECQAAIIVVPNWPTQAWFGKLSNMMIAPPQHISVNKSTLTLPHDPHAIHPLANRLTLLGCHIYNNISNNKDSPRRWPQS